MSKDYGADRMVEKYAQPFDSVRKQVEKMKMSGNYSTVEMSNNGGIFAIEKGKARHKQEEIEAGRYMAKSGYNVTLKDETGMAKTPDGYVYSFSFEQRTPNTDGARSVMKSLEHAKKKSSDVAVIYDKYNKYNRNTIEKGLSVYEQYNKYRFKRIIVISKSGSVYEHSHN